MSLLQVLGALIVFGPVVAVAGYGLWVDTDGNWREMAKAVGCVVGFLLACAVWLLGFFLLTGWGS